MKLLVVLYVVLQLSTGRIRARQNALKRNIFIVAVLGAILFLLILFPLISVAISCIGS